MTTCTKNILIAELIVADYAVVCLRRTLSEISSEKLEQQKLQQRIYFLCILWTHFVTKGEIILACADIDRV